MTTPIVVNFIQPFASFACPSNVEKEAGSMSQPTPPTIKRSTFSLIPRQYSGDTQVILAQYLYAMGIERSGQDFLMEFCCCSCNWSPQERRAQASLVCGLIPTILYNPKRVFELLGNNCILNLNLTCVQPFFGWKNQLQKWEYRSCVNQIGMH